MKKEVYIVRWYTRREVEEKGRKKTNQLMFMTRDLQLKINFTLQWYHMCLKSL